jgi:NAD(P)-dependent dehydrogenase (short-subunit alcohol dehydrogenase family)
MQPFSLHGQNIAITGAAGGIGSAVAQICTTQGASVWLSDVAPPDEMAEELTDAGLTAHASAVDVSDRASVEAWANTCGDIDALIDCAAICPFDEWEEDGWDVARDNVFSINLGGPVNLCRAFMPGMARRGGGRIALVGSIAARIGGVFAAPHYVMSKGGVHSFVRWAAKRGAPDGITVNAVAPGVVDTPMTQNQSFDYSTLPFGRKASAEEIAAPLVFLVAPGAGYISGAVLDVNSGMHFS